MTTDSSFPSAPAEPPREFSERDRQVLLSLARLAIEQSVRHGRLLDVDLEDPSPPCREPRACFVTLTKQGELRGCIGTLVAREPLVRAVMDNARSAALNDTRFPPVVPEELSEIDVHISVLTEPRPLVFASPRDLLDQLRPDRDGVVFRHGGKTATFLPQVWEQIPDKVTFLERLCLKAGLPPSVWQEPGTVIEVYEVESFGDER
jgi:AmmeMemoRadiSam system protein A